MAGIILAAGTSRRMGRGKLLLPFEGRPLVNRAIRAALDGGLDPVVAVIGPGSASELADIFLAEPGIILTRAVDKPVEQSASLKAGLAAILRAEDGEPVAGACVLLGDQPLVDAGLVALLAGAALARPGWLVAPRFKGRRGNPAVIPRDFFSEALRLTGDCGARELFGRHETVTHYVDVEERAAVFDIDTPEDYDTLLKI